MSITLHAHVPFPEQEDGLDVVFPRSANPSLYAQFEKVKDGDTRRVEHASGITIIVEPIEGYPDAHEQINAALRLMETIKITRKKGVLVLSHFELNTTNRPMFGIQTMGDVIAEMERDGPAMTTNEAPPKPSTSDTMVNTGETKPIPTQKPGTPAAPRKLSAEDRMKLQGEKPADTHSAAEEALKRLRSRR